MKIIVDAMGGDNAPMAPVEAAVRAVKELDVEIVLVGKKEVVEKELSAYDYPNDKISIANADEVITNHEEPAKAVRSKKNASVVVAANMLKKGEGDAMLSMGNTGALLASGLLIVGRIKGGEVFIAMLSTIEHSNAVIKNLFNGCISDDY